MFQDYACFCVGACYIRHITSPLFYQNLYISEEFAAHESNVKCLALGQQSGRVLVTGGYDRKVNLWALGNSTYILVSVCLHFTWGFI